MSITCLRIIRTIVIVPHINLYGIRWISGLGSCASSLRLGIHQQRPSLRIHSVRLYNTNSIIFGEHMSWANEWNAANWLHIRWTCARYDNTFYQLSSACFMSCVRRFSCIFHSIRIKCMLQCNMPEIISLHWYGICCAISVQSRPNQLRSRRNFAEQIVSTL